MSALRVVRMELIVFAVLVGSGLDVSCGRLKNWLKALVSGLEGWRDEGVGDRCCLAILSTALVFSAASLVNLWVSWGGGSGWGGVNLFLVPRVVSLMVATLLPRLIVVASRLVRGWRAWNVMVGDDLLLLMVVVRAIDWGRRGFLLA
jgi:hypothetical protein